MITTASRVLKSAELLNPGDTDRKFSLTGSDIHLQSQGYSWLVGADEDLTGGCFTTAQLTCTRNSDIAWSRSLH
jgi:hypothetical protein